MLIDPRRTAVHAGQGFLMGAADIVPGVSGGTVALVVGIYERLVRSIRAAAAVPVVLARGDGRAARQRLGEVDWALVVPLVLGIVAAIAVGALTLLPLIEAYPEHTAAVFFGLIVASLALPWGRVQRRSRGILVAAAGGAVAAFVLVGLPEIDAAAPSLPRVAATAAVAICAMILPGVSGAYLLTVFGIYTPTLEALRALDVAYIATFVAGAALGLGLFAKLLETLLARWHDATMAVLTGLMVGALRALWPWLDDERALLVPPAEPTTAVVVALGIAAFVGLRLLLRLGDRAAASA